MTRAAKPSHCPRCQQPTLTGPDDDTAALTITTGTQPLTARAEAAALLAGQATYAVRRIAGQPTLTRRDHWAITARPANQIHVVADHSCDGHSIHDRARIPTPPPNPRQEAQGEFPF